MPDGMIYVFDEEERLNTILAHSDEEDGDAVFWDASVTRDLEGKYNFEFKTNKRGEHLDFMTSGYKVGIFDRDSRFQVFDIISPEDTRTSRRNLTVKARHIFHELLDAPRIMDKRPTDTSLEEALIQCLEDVPNWKVRNVANTLGTNSDTLYRINPLKGAQTIRDTWGSELNYYVELQGGQIGDRVMEAPERLGENRGAMIEIGQNASEINRKVDRKGLKTAMYAFGKGEKSGDGYGRRITIADASFNTDNGDPFDKPEGQIYVADEEARQRFGRLVNGEKVHRFGDYEDEQENDPEALAEAAWEALQKANTPNVTYECEAIDLENKTDEFGERYRAYVFRLGDDVAVMDTVFKPHMRVQARIIKEEDPFPYGQSGEKRKLTLGNFKPKITEDERLDRISEIIGDKYGQWEDKVSPGDDIKTSWLQGNIDTLNNEIESTNGYVYMTDQDGLSIYDKPREENPTQVINLKGGALRVANSKDRFGNWEFSTFGTGEGFTAELLNSGEILTELIRIVGDTYFFWDDKNIVLADPDNSQKQLRIGLYDDENYGIGFTTNGGRTWRQSIGFDGIQITPEASYSEGYNPRENEEAAFEGIGVDYGGNPPTFTRASEAYDYDVNHFAEGEPVFAHGGILLQHATENQLRGPEFAELGDEDDPISGGADEEGTTSDGGQDDSDSSYQEEKGDEPESTEPSRIESDDNIMGWTRGNWYGSTNRNRVEGISPYSQYCLRFERWNRQENSTSSIYSWGMEVEGGEIYSISFYVYAPRNDKCRISFRDSTNLEHFYRDFVGTGRWERMEFYQRLPESCSEARVYIFNNDKNNRIHYYSNIFFGKGYPCPYVSGERDKDLLTIGADHVFRRNKGCIELKGVVPRNLEQTLFNMIIDEELTEGAEPNRFLLRLTEEGEVHVQFGDTDNTITSKKKQIRANKPFQIAINWSDERSQWELWLNGKRVNSRKFIEPEVFPDDVEINEDHVLILQDLRISKKARSDNELQQGGDHVYVGNATHIRRRGYETVDPASDGEE